MDFDPDARERTFKVKVVAAVQPVLPDAMPGHAGPTGGAGGADGHARTSRTGKFPKIAYSLRATGSGRSEAGRRREGGLTCGDRGAGLRAWAKGDYAQEAGVELLIRAFGGQFAQRGCPWVRPCHRPGWYWLDVRTLLDYSGGLLRRRTAGPGRGRRAGRRPPDRWTSATSARRARSPHLTLVLGRPGACRRVARAGRAGPPRRPAGVRPAPGAGAVADDDRRAA